MRAKSENPTLHAAEHFGLGTDPHEMVLVPASIMGTVVPGITMDGGFALYGGTIYLPDRDGPTLQAGEQITVSYSHFEPATHFSWLAARIHVVTGLKVDEYDYVHPWESEPWNGTVGVGGTLDIALTGSPTIVDTFHYFMALCAATDEDGDTISWSGTLSGGALSITEQYAFDLTGVGHLAYAFYDFGGSIPGQTGTLAGTSTLTATEKHVAWQYNLRDGTPVLGDMVGEEIFDGTMSGGTTSEVGVTLTEDIPAGSQLVVVTARYAPNFVPTDAGSRPQIIVRLPTSGSFVPKWRRNGQHHTLPEMAAIGSAIGVTDVDGGSP